MAKIETIKYDHSPIQALTERMLTSKDISPVKEDITELKERIDQLEKENIALHRKLRHITSLHRRG